MIFSLVCTFLYEWVCGCFCVFVCGFLLFTEGTSVSEIFLLYSSKTDFSLYFLHSHSHTFSADFSSLFYSVLLREVNPTDETDPFCVCLFVVLFSSSCYFLFENAFFPGGNKPFNWLIFCLFCSLGLKIHCVDWCVCV